MRDIIMVGPANFNVRVTGEFPQAGTCISAETLNQGCGTRTISDYAAGIVATIGLGLRGEYNWEPADYTPTQRPPDYSACGPGGMQLHIQPPWVTEVRYASAAGFKLSSVPYVPGSGNTQARAKKVAAERFMSTRVGRTLILRAQHRPQPAGGPSEGTWTATIRAKRIR
jgi:hypothetical protein